MKSEDTSEVLAVARPTQSRRALALVALSGLGAVVLYYALTQPVPVMAKVVLMSLGAIALWGAGRMRVLTAGCVELTARGLRDGDGTVIADIDDIALVERGVFAFKPSNGFLVRTHVSHKRGWRLGVWWRVGRRIGVGGMMPLHQTKLMAEHLATLIEKRDPAD